MPASPSDYYAALCARDRRFDGRFYVGVSTTRIYCRPVCAVRTPRFENCSFYPSAAAAEAHGFRPCLRCRPELAPGVAPIDAAGRYAAAAARLIDQGFLSGQSCEGLAQRLGISARHLRRVFADRYGVSPVGYAQSQRLLLAKRLLAETALPVTEIALAAGFGSLRRFNGLVRERYRLSPSELRRTAPAARAPHGGHGLHLRLAYRPPLDWAAMLSWLARRAIGGIEAVHGDQYVRSISLMHGGKRLDGWVGVRADASRHALSVEPSASLVPALPLVLARMRRLFDLDASPGDIAAVLGDLAAPRTGLRLPGAVSGFEGAARAVLEQQVSTSAAACLLKRLAERFGEPVPTPWPSVDRLFPAAAALACACDEDIAAIGIPRQRARALRLLAIEAAEGRLDLDDVIDVERGLARLQEIPGIGPWTAGYIAMRAWSWPDVFLCTDYVVRKRLPGMSPGAIDEHARRWSPWRSYAVFHLWASDAPPAP
ncbi:DNA-3-methyladenine glycosylase 2 [Thauera sinica]|uniref:DNA-3-methyladenine glycosylase II n=1 Tax=Thauera sinica TaxID=2665146 RepID=A0ABW1AS57_9RHOO|nr:DNA-3-methyladenine glycosylase 2 [Thauera sp. K11]ATE60115.1 DNA-3-methyladenine glycosylase 2 [Thauera sp. K11]